MSTVTVCLDNNTMVPALLAEAEARGCRPQQLVVALVRLTLESGMVDAVLDGEDPAKIAPNAGRHGRKVTDPLSLTDIQRRCLALVASGGVAGWSASVSDMAASLEKGRGQARNMLLALMRRGLVERLERGNQAHPSVYRITSAGHAALERGAR